MQIERDLDIIIKLAKMTKNGHLDKSELESLEIDNSFLIKYADVFGMEFLLSNFNFSMNEIYKLHKHFVSDSLEFWELVGTYQDITEIDLRNSNYEKYIRAGIGKPKNREIVCNEYFIARDLDHLSRIMYNCIDNDFKLAVNIKMLESITDEYIDNHIYDLNWTDISYTVLCIKNPLKFILKYENMLNFRIIFYTLYNYFDKNVFYYIINSDKFESIEDSDKWEYFTNYLFRCKYDKKLLEKYKDNLKFTMIGMKNIIDFKYITFILDNRKAFGRYPSKYLSMIVSKFKLSTRFLNKYCNILDMTYLANKYKDEKFINKYRKFIDISELTNISKYTKELQDEIYEEKYGYYIKRILEEINKSKHYRMVTFANVPLLKYIADKNISVDWGIICKYNIYISTKFIRDHINLIDWDCLLSGRKSKNITINEKFIDEFYDYIDFDVLISNQKLSENIIRKYIDKFDMRMIIQYQKLSNQFLYDFKDKINWNDAEKYQGKSLKDVENLIENIK